MRKIIIYNHKGGSGKTTTAINLAAGLARQGKRVILLDLDPQGALSSCMKVAANDDAYKLLLGTASAEQCITPVGKNLLVIPAGPRLYRAKSYLYSLSAPLEALDRRLQHIEADYLIIDSPPSRSILTENALYYVDEAIVPAPTTALGRLGLNQTIQELVAFNEKHNKQILVSSIVPTLFRESDPHHRAVHDWMVREFTSMLTMPAIHEHKELGLVAEKQASIFSFAPLSTAAKDYFELVNRCLFNEPCFDAYYSKSVRQQSLQAYFTSFTSALELVRGVT